MISFKKEKGRCYFGMSPSDMVVFAQLIWHWKHDPEPIGFNRKPMTAKQKAIVEDLYDRINYPDNYCEQLNQHGL